MTHRSNHGFPVFSEYVWTGPEIDAEIAPHIAVDQRHSTVNSWAVLWAADPSLAAMAKESFLSVAYHGWEQVASFQASERPTLFLELADVELTRNGILRFVKLNGLLNISAGRPSEPKNQDWKACDSFFDIVEQVTAMRRALALLVEIGRLREAGKCAAVASYKEMLAEQVNPHIKGTPELLDSNLDLEQRHDRLIDAIWEGFKQAIAHRARIYSCDRCGRFFQVADKAANTKQHYCGNTCKVAAYRERKRTAAMLRAEGATLLQIARMTGSDVETIKGWLADKGVR